MKESYNRKFEVSKESLVGGGHSMIYYCREILGKESLEAKEPKLKTVKWKALKIAKKEENFKSLIIEY